MNTGKENNNNEMISVPKLSEDMRRHLKGKSIHLCGQDAVTKDLMGNSLDYVNRQNELQLDISSGQKVLRKGDLAIVIGEMSGTGSECLEQLDQFMTEMESIGRAEPEAVIYISDSRVYGKSFGPQRSCREDELGYVCHTALGETDLQCMRLAEHLVCRMAKEQNIPVKVVRLDQKPGARELYELMPYILVLLLKGVPGEIYNVTGTADLQQEEKENTAETKLLSWKENRSPLTAMEIRMNTEKVRNYVASELFE